MDHCLELYRRLYLDKYSAYNPDYAPDYVRELLRQGMLELHTLEDGNAIVAFCGLHGVDNALSVPLLGYDFDHAQAADLYRMIMTIGPQEGQRRGLYLNWSAGAPDFKCHRGARPYIEYMAIADQHLPHHRQWGYGLLAAALKPLEHHLMRHIHDTPARPD